MVDVKPLTFDIRTPVSKNNIDTKMTQLSELLNPLQLKFDRAMRMSERLLPVAVIVAALCLLNFITGLIELNHLTTALSLLACGLAFFFTLSFHIQAADYHTDLETIESKVNAMKNAPSAMYPPLSTCLNYPEVDSYITAIKAQQRELMRFEAEALLEWCRTKQQMKLTVNYSDPNNGRVYEAFYQS